MKDEKTTIKQGETVSRLTSIHGDICNVTRLTTHNTQGKLECDWTFDFTDVSNDELIKLAVRSLIIDQQRDIRAAKGADVDPLLSGTIKVRDKLDSMRKGKTDAEKVMTLTGRMTTEQKADLIARLTEA